VPPICASSIKYDTETPFSQDQLLINFRFVSYLEEDSLISIETGEGIYDEIR
jgi:hypothetical protein